MHKCRSTITCTTSNDFSNNRSSTAQFEVHAWYAKCQPIAKVVSTIFYNILNYRKLVPQHQRNAILYRSASAHFNNHTSLPQPCLIPSCKEGATTRNTCIQKVLIISTASRSNSTSMLLPGKPEITAAPKAHTILSKFS